jgi:predicted phosphoribosyltransferase/alpha-beta hydrolase superfamily lysophospholipase
VRFADRRSAGAQLAERLAYLRDQDPIVVGLPRGGVPVAHEVAAALRAPLDVVVVRKLGAPHRPELAAGAVGEGGVIVLNDDVVRHLHISQEQLSEIARRERAELERQAELFRRGRPGIDVRDRTVIIIDDGIATGSTTSAAIRVVRALGARRIVLAVPVAPPDVVTALSSQADEVVCLHAPAELFSVGTWYRDFSQVSDGEVSELLGQHEVVPRPRDMPGEPSPRATEAAEGSGGARVPAQARSSAGAAAGIDEYVEVPVGAHRRLPGHLTAPPDAAGVVIFAHGSGSSRHSPRNRSVAAALNSAGLGTLLLDLLDTAEESDRCAVFDIELLAGRLAAAADMVCADRRLPNVPVGYFGASTGAAAALSAAAIPGSPVRAIVSRGGRPDLAESHLADVTAPTLLIVGGRDDVVLELNRFAQRRMRCPNKLAVIPGAAHLFTEPGALDRVCELAVDWFTRYLTPAAVSR